MRILFFGDSITQGFYDQAGGWVQRLAKKYQGPAQDIEIFNLGVSGDCAKDLIERLENEAKIRRWRDDKLVVAIAVGINDARLVDNRAVSDVYDFQQELEKLIKIAGKVADAVLCVGLSAVDEEQTNPWPYSSTGAQWSNNRINAFEDTIKQSAQRLNVPFVAIHDSFLAQVTAGQDLLADGLHPNEAGHQLIAELVKPALEPLLPSA